MAPAARLSRHSRSYRVPAFSMMPWHRRSFAVCGRFLRSAINDVYRNSEKHAFIYQREMADLDDLADRHRLEAYEFRRSIFNGIELGEIVNWATGVPKRQGIAEADIRASYDRWERELGPGALSDRLQSIGLAAFDRRWSEHLTRQYELYDQASREEGRIGKQAVAELCAKSTAGFQETIMLVKKDIIDGLLQ